MERATRREGAIVPGLLQETIGSGSLSSSLLAGFLIIQQTVEKPITLLPAMLGKKKGALRPSAPFHFLAILELPAIASAAPSLAASITTKT
jgi:hypothetical protein